MNVCRGQRALLSAQAALPQHCGRCRTVTAACVAPSRPSVARTPRAARRPGLVALRGERGEGRQVHSSEIKKAPASQLGVQGTCMQAALNSCPRRAPSYTARSAAASSPLLLSVRQPSAVCFRMSSSRHMRLRGEKDGLLGCRDAAHCHCSGRLPRCKAVCRQISSWRAEVPSVSSPGVLQRLHDLPS